MRVTVPEGRHPLLYIQTDIGSPDLRDTLQKVSQTLFVNDSTVTPKEREAARYYAAWMVDCDSCAQWRAARDLPGYAGEPISDEWYDNIHRYQTWPGFTPRERLAIDFTQRFLNDHRALSADDQAWDLMHRNFTETEIYDLCIISSLMAASGMMREVLVVTPESSCGLPTSN
ncbi:carboxymuconolactone decarboxylase family protein [Kribbella sp. NPDC051587]|uniref:carboxymuconolactone decarboxylase family protein n=1 Tax=Kribbella sp. NPDC051587 TaxID=3364119 RepID=UPI003788196A